MAHHQATPTLLKSGEWGARVLAPKVGVGDQLTVVAKNGNTWKAQVDGIVWQGTDVVLCRISRSRVAQADTGCQRVLQQGRSLLRAARAHSGYCTQCGHRAVDCSFHAAMGGLCGECAFDEYDM